MSVMLDVLKAPGQPHESDWPYLAQLPTPLSTWTPPGNAGQIFQHAFDALPVVGRNPLAIIDQKEVVILILAITEQFFHLPRSNRHPNKLPMIPMSILHALLGVGNRPTG